MIAKTFFLAKIIHRIGTRSIRQKKSLLENQAENRTFFVPQAARRAEFCIALMNYVCADVYGVVDLVVESLGAAARRQACRGAGADEAAPSTTARG
jgi:hypothetical protein